MKRIIFAALAVIMAAALCGCGGKLPENTVHAAADMPGRTVGVLAGSPAEGYLGLYGQTMDVRSYDSAEALARDLASGRLDCAVADEATFDDMSGEVSGLRALDEKFIDRSYAIAVSEDNGKLLENLDSAIDKLRNSGELGDITDVKRDVSREEPAEQDTGLTAVTVAVDPSFPPYAAYGASGALEGVEIDLAKRLCSILGLRPEFVAAEPDMLLYMAESGKVSFAIGRITADPEAASVLYTRTYMDSTQLIVVRKG